MTVTNHMLRQKIAEINRQTRYIKSGGGTYNALDDKGTVLLSEREIIAVEGDYVITKDGSKSFLYNPVPCLYWKCTGAPDSNGRITLKKSLTGLFIDDGSDSYCLGLRGLSDEFEIRFQVGTNEIRLNNELLNIISPCIIRNGLEEK